MDIRKSQPECVGERCAMEQRRVINGWNYRDVGFTKCVCLLVYSIFFRTAQRLDGAGLYTFVCAGQCLSLRLSSFRAKTGTPHHDEEG